MHFQFVLTSPSTANKNWVNKANKKTWNYLYNAFPRPHICINLDIVWYIGERRGIIICINHQDIDCHWDTLLYTIRSCHLQDKKKKSRRGTYFNGVFLIQFHLWENIVWQLKISISIFHFCLHLQLKEAATELEPAVCKIQCKSKMKHHL